MTAKMFTVRAGAELGVPGVEWTNCAVLADQELPAGHLPDPGNFAQGVGSGFWNMETPLFLIDPAKGRVPLADVEPAIGRDIWLISGRAKRVFENVDAAGFEFVRVKIKTRSDHAEVQSDPEYWLCDVVRFLDALDEEKSSAVVKSLSNGVKRARRRGIGTEVLKSSVIGRDSHIFRLMYAPSAVYATESFVDAVTKAKLTGVKIGDGGRLDA